MKVKIAKRSASDYEESLSSHDSCRDSIITHHQLTSLASSSSLRSCILIAQECFTPPKNTTQNQKSYSLKKFANELPNEWNQIADEKANQNNIFWVCQSQDSKVRKRQDKYSQQQNKKFKQHIKVLKFEDQIQYCDHDKENQPSKSNANKQESSSDQETEQIFKIRSTSKRVVGKVLLIDQSQSNKLKFTLPQIPEESFY